jgi:YfiH family protein
MATNFQISPDGAFLYHHSLSAYKEIIHGFALRRNPATGLEKSYGLNGYQPHSQVLENRGNLMASLFSPIATDKGKKIRLVTLKQVHSDEIVVAEDLAFPEPPAVGDGLLTRQPGLLLAVQTADCMPVLILDPRSGAVAAVHAGWRGTLKRIMERAIRRMQTGFGSDPDQCIAVVGPSIRKCCYSVGGEMLSAYHAEFSYASSLFTPSPEAVSSLQEPVTSHKKWFLDLPSACKQQLLDCGLKEARIFADPPCTACDTQRFFSHRVDAGQSGRMMSVIGILPVTS